jgi:cytochrome c biogenesis protein CcdA
MAAHLEDAAPHDRLERESAGNLLSRLLSDASALVRNEVQLAKAELRETTSSVKEAVSAIAIGAAVLLAGVFALIAAVILALAQVVEPWVAALIVGAGLAIIGLIMLQAARKKLDSGHLGFERTQSSLKRDVRVVARRT